MLKRTELPENEAKLYEYFKLLCPMSYPQAYALAYMVFEKEKHADQALQRLYHRRLLYGLKEGDIVRTCGAEEKLASGHEDAVWAFILFYMKANLDNKDVARIGKPPAELYFLLRKEEKTLEYYLVTSDAIGVTDTFIRNKHTENKNTRFVIVSSDPKGAKDHIIPAGTVCYYACVTHGDDPLPEVNVTKLGG